MQSSNNFNSSDSRKQEKSSPTTKQKEQGKKPGRKIVAPVPFRVEDDSIRITDNSVIGNGLVQMGSGGAQPHRGSKVEKLQGDTKANTNLGLRESSLVSTKSNNSNGLASVANQGFI